MTPLPEPTIFVVDDDGGVRESLVYLLKSVDLKVETYASAGEFLEAYDNGRPGCLVLDVRMPRMSGVELQQRLAGEGITLPVILITGHGDVTTAVRAMKSGAADFLEKPFNDQVLLDRIQWCIERDAERRREDAHLGEIRRRIATLTPRQRQVMELVIAGRSSKQIGRDLGASPKTIEVHRAQIMQKMGAESLAGLFHMVTENSISISKRI